MFSLKGCGVDWDKLTRSSTWIMFHMLNWPMSFDRRQDLCDSAIGSESVFRKSYAGFDINPIKRNKKPDIWLAKNIAMTKILQDSLKLSCLLSWEWLATETCDPIWKRVFRQHFPTTFMCPAFDRSTVFWNSRGFPHKPLLLQRAVFSFGDLQRIRKPSQMPTLKWHWELNLFICTSCSHLCAMGDSLSGKALQGWWQVQLAIYLFLFWRILAGNGAKPDLFVALDFWRLLEGTETTIVHHQVLFYHFLEMEFPPWWSSRAVRALGWHLQSCSFWPFGGKNWGAQVLHLLMVDVHLGFSDKPSLYQRGSSS